MRHGIGSFVTGLNEDHREFTLSSFRQTVGTQAEAIATEVVFRTRTTSNAAAAAALEIGDRSVSSIGRKRSLRSRVLVFQISYVSEEYADVLYAYEPGSSLYTSLNGYLDTVVTQAEERISAIAAPESVTSHLGSDDWYAVSLLPTGEQRHRREAGAL
jgi:DNA-binding GntR family transcriptional regulator